MIGSLFEDLQPIPNNEDEDSQNAENLSYDADSDDYLLTALPVVQKIVRRKNIISWQSEASDLVQEVVLRLIKWRERNCQKSAEMSPDDWRSYAARTAYNEINRHNSNSVLRTEVPLESESEATAQDSVVEGQSDAEVCTATRKKDLKKLR